MTAALAGFSCQGWPDLIRIARARDVVGGGGGALQPRPGWGCPPVTPTTTTSATGGTSSTTLPPSTVPPTATTTVVGGGGGGGGGGQVPVPNPPGAPSPSDPPVVPTPGGGTNPPPNPGHPTPIGDPPSPPGTLPPMPDPGTGAPPVGPPVTVASTTTTRPMTTTTAAPTTTATPTTAAPTTAAPTTTLASTTTTAPTTTSTLPGGSTSSTAPGGTTTSSSPTTTAPSTTVPTTVPPATTASSTTTTTATSTTVPGGDVPVEDEVAHVLRRLSFGTTPAMRREASEQGIEAWIARQLDPASIDDSQIEGVIAGFGTLTASNASNYEAEDDVVRNELRHATILRAYGSNRQLHEVMVEFWNNHFSVFLNDSYLVALKTSDDLEVARAHALGRFSDLLLASAHSEAMLEYLNNNDSNANSQQGVNENWGRELLELHTLGIVDGEQVYGEADVLALANVMSGWSWRWETKEFEYRPAYHFEGPVSLLGGAWSTAGNSGTAGYDDGVSALNFLARHPSTARHVCTKLARRFVDDVPDPALVEQLAAVYLANDTNIAATLAALFASPTFRAARRTKIRRPFELVVAQLRALNAQVEPGADSNASRTLHTLLGEMANLPFSWPAPNGYPDVAEYWASADGMLNRWELGGRLANNALNGIAVDLAALLSPMAATAGELLDQLGLRLLDGGFAPTERAALLAYLGKADTDAVTAAELDAATLGTLVGLALDTPSFQLR